MGTEIITTADDKSLKRSSDNGYQPWVDCQQFYTLFRNIPFTFRKARRHNRPEEGFYLRHTSFYNFDFTDNFLQNHNLACFT